MTRKILESFSMEEAFKALNRKAGSRHNLTESRASNKKSVSVRSKSIVEAKNDDKLAELKAFVAADDEGAIVGWLEDFYADFLDDAYAIVEKHGFEDVSSDVAAQGTVNDVDMFTATKNGVEYFGEYNLALMDKKMKRIAMTAKSYTDACSAAAKWYADTMISNLKPDAQGSKLSEKVIEGSDTSNFTEVDPAEFGYDEDAFADDVANLAYAEDSTEGYQSVPTYYAEKQLPESDLKVVKIFINPAMYIDDIDYDMVEEFGFELANGDCLYTRSNHDVGPAFVKCKNFASMRNYVVNGYEQDSANADDLIEG